MDFVFFILFNCCNLITDGTFKFTKDCTDQGYHDMVDRDQLTEERGFLENNSIRVTIKLIVCFLLFFILFFFFNIFFFNNI